MSARPLLFTAAFAALLAAAGTARADETVSLTITLRDHRFDPAELRAPANTRIQLKVINEDPVSEEFDSRALKVEKVIAGKSEGIVRISSLAPGRYEFIGEYHEDTAKGVLIAE
ncbi:MAG TPA: cupredoxin domain-containing protein [Xanthobacteraceae bacterium]|nr:cupredoxin domain-containing protein [Xanthobacteraceae bacterium]